MEIKKWNLVKKILPIVRVSDRDVFPKVCTQMFFNILSWALVMTFQILVVVLSALGMVSR